MIELKITCKANENGTLTVRAATINDSVFQEGYQRLAASKMQLTKFSGTLVEGSILCDRDGLMYTSIPQNGNWTVLVDGKETEPVLVGDVMLAVPLTQGEHDLCFVYRSEAFSLGLTVSLVCFGIFLAIILVQYYPKYKDKLPKFKK